MPPQERTVNVETNKSESLREPLLSLTQQYEVEANVVLEGHDPVHCATRENDGETTSDLSPNIRWILSYTLFAFAGRAIWYQSVLSTYCYLLRNDNPESVGFITSVMGISQLLASVPTGVLADRWSPSRGGRRDVLIRIAVVIGTIAIGITVLSVYEESFVLLTIALACWGLVWGIVNTVLTAIFADSILDGDRSKYFTQRSILIKLGNTMGPTVSLILFAVLGDKWTIHDCSIVMLVGQIICLPSIFLLCCPSDKHVVVPVSLEAPCDQNDDTMDVAAPTNNFVLSDVNMTASEASLPLLLLPSSESRDSDDNKDDDLVSTLESEVTDNNSVLFQNMLDESNITASASERWFCFRQDRMVPILVAVADITSGLASGMSIRYFPIFFYENLNLGPVIVQVLGILCPLAGTLLSHFAQRWSLTIGPCRMTCIYKWIGLSCMVSMILSYKLSLPIWCTCAFYILRTSFMNSTSALTKSVLMDAVPSHERGKWSALESVNMFSWSGSAAVGGIMVGFEGILFNFCITAALQFAATMPLVILFTKFEKRQRNEEPEGALSPCTIVSNDDGDRTPLGTHFTNDDRFKVARS